MTIRTLGDPVLREKAKPVEKIDGKIKKLVKSMTKTMGAAPGIGLAAPQVGILRQVAVLNVSEEIICLINPEIISKSKTEKEEEEGCLSVPNVTVPVKRAIKIKVRALNIKGECLEMVAEGLMARIIQHEIDHLNGILIIDRTSKDEKRRILRELSEVPLL